MDRSAEGRQPLTQLLELARGGDASARERLYPLVYDELRELAAASFRSQRSDHTLQPTALVHEAWIKLSDQTAAPADRVHFFALAARTMRQLLVDHARARATVKREGVRAELTVSGFPAALGTDALDVLVLDEALERLARHSETQARIVELRFFGGLSGDEAAAEMGLSPSSVDREWRFARAWLALQLEEKDVS